MAEYRKNSQQHPGRYIGTTKDALTIANAADNRVVTSTGGTGLNAEIGLAYDSSLPVFSCSAQSSTFQHAGVMAVDIINNANDANAGVLNLKNARGAAGADNDYCGTIGFYGSDEGGATATSFAQIVAQVADATNGQEAGRLEFKVQEYDGTLTTGLKLDGDTDADGEIDVTIGAGAASITTIAGDLDIDGDKITTAGNIEIEAGGSGTITLDSAGAITLERGSSTVEVPDVAGTLQVVDTVKYLFANDFIVNDATYVRNYRIAADDAGSNYGLTWADGGIEAWSWYQIPKGFKVTHIHAYGNVTSSTDVSIYQLDPTDGTRGSALASGTWNVNHDLSSDITSADDAVALVVLNPDAATDIIYSVKLTLAVV